jgi:UDP:flavonoid glycosyltransferase YjiC (YdhE family)
VRIAILATGSRGDVEPYIALGKGLKKAGHRISIISHQNFDSLTSSHGLDFWGIAGNVQEIAQSNEMSQRIERGSFLSVLSQMKKEAEKLATEAAETGVSACKNCDLIIAGLGGLFTAASLAEKLEIPLIQAYYIPFTPTSEIPSFLMPKLPLSFGLANRLSFHLTRQIIWQGFSSADNKARKQILNIHKSPYFGPYKNLTKAKDPIIYGYSPSIIPHSYGSEANTHVTGFWFLDEPSNWTPPQDLADFIDSGSPPIYIGFGSMSSTNPEETTNLILSALNKTKQRAIISSGWNGINGKALPSNVFMIDSVPFSWLFPKMAAVVHHGGAGTTHYGVRAGVPSIVVPFFADQPFWGRRIAELGVGPKPIPRKKITAKTLAKAIEVALTDSAIRDRAAELGQRVQKENGVELAVKIISSWR